MLFERFLDRLNRGQRVVVGVTIDRARRIEQRPVERDFAHGRAAKVKRIGAVARRVRIAARGHSQQMVDRYRPPRVAIVEPEPGRSCDIRFAALDRRTDQRSREALGDRPGALRQIRVVSLRIGFAPGAIVLPDHHRRRPGPLAVVFPQSRFGRARGGRRDSVAKRIDIGIADPVDSRRADNLAIG